VLDVVGELETGAFCLNRKTQHLFKLLSLYVAHNTEIFSLQCTDLCTICELEVSDVDGVHTRWTV
jgi:hypothetical protein